MNKRLRKGAIASSHFVNVLGNEGHASGRFEREIKFLRERSRLGEEQAAQCLCGLLQVSKCSLLMLSPGLSDRLLPLPDPNPLNVGR